MVHCSDTIFMLVTLNPAIAILSFDILSPDIALSPCIIPVTLILWPTCGLRSSELINSTPSGCFLFFNMYLPSFSATQPVIVICLLMESDFFMEESLDMPVCANNETEPASTSMVIQHILIFIFLLLINTFKRQFEINLMRQHKHAAKAPRDD